MFIFVLSFIFRLCIGLLLIIAGVGKLRMPKGAFTRIVLGYELLPSTVVKFLSWSIPISEIILGVFLVLGLWLKWVTILAAILLCAFSFAVTINLLRGKKNDCGCTRKGDVINWGIPLRNLVLVMILILVV